MKAPGRLCAGLSPSFPVGPSLVAASLQALHGIFPVHASVPDIYPCNRDTGHIGLTATRITSFSFADFSEAYLTQVTVRAPGNLDFLVTFLGELDSTCNKAQAQTERCRGRNQLPRGLHNSSGGRSCPHGHALWSLDAGRGAGGRCPPGSVSAVARRPDR